MAWSDVYSVGSESLDAQHKNLIALIERMSEHMTTNTMDDNEVRETFNEISRYIDEHFSYEEGMLAEAGYADLEEHKRIHKALKDQIDAVHQRFDDNDPSAKEDLYFLLVSDWLASHILGTDMAYSPIVKAHFGGK